VEFIRSRFGDDIEDRTSRPAKFIAEITRLNGNFLHVIDDVNGLRSTRERHVVIVGAVEKIVVSARALAIDRKLGSLSSDSISCAA